MIEKSKYVILLDNGHGINTPGKQSPDKSLQEYKYAREIVQKVYSSLKELGYLEKIKSEYIKYKQ